ncbi:hypothetical protein J2W28_001031 [Variovorax boronicumulans]|nr:hypothetical protein [Variovorax boronicumulans]MDQ0001898.1 hypothetical protein [Variovorax boronicumulans]
MGVNPKHATFEQGQLEAIEIALATLVRVLPAPSKQAFMVAFPKNVETWDNTALPSSAISDEWLRGLRETAAGLLRLANPSA